MSTLSCPHCRARGDSYDETTFDLRGQAHGKAVYKCMACGNGLTKGGFGKAKPIPAADWIQIERRFEEHFEPRPETMEGIAYSATASVMARVARSDDVLYEQDQLLAVACLVAAGRSLDAIAAANQGPVAERLRSRASEDPFVASAVTAMACYYLFAFGESNVPADARGRWAEGMLRGLAPIEEAIPEDSRALGPLFDSYTRRSDTDDGHTRFALRFAKWFLASTTGEVEEDLALMAMGELAAGAKSGMEGFARDLSTVGLG